MALNTFRTVLFLLISGMASFALAQTPEAAIKPTYYIGDVAVIGAGAMSITTKSGVSAVVLNDKTAYKRVSAEKPDLPAATPGVLTDISVGDKVTVSALLGSDGKSMNARTVYFISKVDIDAKSARETAEWKTRGITGKVTAVNPQTNQITVQMSGLTGTTTVAVTPKENARFLHYAPDSVRYDEAKPSSIAEIKVSDLIRAVGDKSTDGASFAAEKVLIGSFQTTAGTVKTVDVEKNEVVIKDLATGKDVTISTASVTTFKKFPAEMAERMAGFQMGGARPAGQGGGQARPPQPGGQTTGQPAPGGQGRGNFGGARPGAGSVDEMLDRFPPITTADLKPGDMIAVSSTRNGVTDHIKAIKLLAGVEPFLRMAQSSSGAGQRGQGVQGGFSIPGLDGIGTP